MDEIKKRMFTENEQAELEREAQRFLESCNKENLTNILITAAVNQTVVLPAILERLVVALEHFIDLRLEDTEIPNAQLCQSVSLDGMTMKNQDDHQPYQELGQAGNVPL